MASAAPTDLNVAPTRLAGSRGGARAPILAVALVLVAVVAAGVLGDRPGTEPRTDARSGVRMVDATAIGATTIRAALGETYDRESAASLLPTRAMRLEQPRVIVGPPPWAYTGRMAPPGSTRLRVLGWQVDPYQT